MHRPLLYFIYFYKYRYLSVERNSNDIKIDIIIKFLKYKNIITLKIITPKANILITPRLP